MRRVEAIENLGSMDILCTDKTGTLTTGIVELDSAVNPSGRPSDNVMRLATINTRLETGIANPLDQAIVAAAETRNIETHAINKIDEVPYDFVRKRLTIVAAENNSISPHIMITKGAFDNVLECCDRIVTQGGPQWITERDRQRLQEYYKAKGSAGYRVLGVATKEVSGQSSYCRSDESAMLFEGMLLFLDPLKQGIAETIREFERLGIAIKIITGDNRHVAGHVGESVGLNTSRILTGDKLAETHTEALWNLASRPTFLRKSIRSKKNESCRLCSTVVTQSGISVTASMTRPHCTQRTSVSRLIKPSMSPARAPTLFYWSAIECVTRWHCQRSSHVRQYAEIHFDHHQREFWQYDQYGRRDIVFTLLAAAGKADPAQQFSF